MYAFISGVLEEKTESNIVINAGGIGYELSVSLATLNSLPKIGDVVTVYTYLQVKEDEMSLFGFSTKEEKNMFMQLISVSGVGAKTAIAVLSSMSIQELISSFAYGDPSRLAKVKGLGKKTAERIVVDLKGKFNGFEIAAPSLIDAPLASNAAAESVDLLVTMGLTKIDATNLVKRVANIDDTTEQIIAKALREIG